MSAFVEIAPTADLPVGTARTFIIEERKIALFHTASGFFATDNSCPHRGGPLGEGDLIGDEIVCPWHLWSFNVATGQNDVYENIRLACHPVRVENDRIYVQLAPPIEVAE